MNFFLELYKLFQQESMSPFCFTYLSILHILDQYWDSGGFFFFKKKIVFERISKCLKLKNTVLIATVLPFGLAGGPATN